MDPQLPDPEPRKTLESSYCLVLRLKYQNYIVYRYERAGHRPPQNIKIAILRILIRRWLTRVAFWFPKGNISQPRVGHNERH